MRHRPTRSPAAPAGELARRALRRRGDDGNIVAVTILMIVLVTLAGAMVATLPGGFSTASSSQQGEQAVAQANDGLRDATFRLDQLGDTVTSFCSGNPPAALLSAAGLTAAQCSPTGSSPLPNAPGLRYYVANRQAVVQDAGVTDEVTVTSVAVVGQQHRTVTATLYRVANDFGFFGVSGLDDHGALKNAQVAEVGNGGSVLSGGTVSFGIGPNGNPNCQGETGTSPITTLGGSGSGVVGGGCPGATSTASAIEPVQAQICQPGQNSQSFAPCVDTSSYAVDGTGIPTCPLPNVPLASLAPGIADDAPAHPSPFAVYDCSTQGLAVTISATSAQSLPPGNYYLDSNNVTVRGVDPASLAGGPVSLYVLPLACGSGGVNCPVYVPPSSAANAVSPPQTGSTNPVCNDPPPPYFNQSASLSIPGTLINSYGVPPAQPGNPANFSLYWTGDNVITGGAQPFDGYLFAPGAILVSNGSGNGSTAFYGSFVLNCWQVNGGPNLTFAQPLHARQYLTGWVAAHYSITP